MLKIDRQQIRRMAADGTQVLRSLQNKHTNEIDLLVRESIQNSLDAGFYEKDVYVDFTTSNFSSKEFLELLEDTNNIKNKYKNHDRQKTLIISDRNTVGLDGPLSHEYIVNQTDSRNLLKLVYDVGKAQSAKGAGGSWGYGKSIYYRIGIGLVVYYTRVKLPSGEYQERLVACLVEDHSQKETLVEYSNYDRTGIVWWGQYVEGIDTSIPITNSNDIKEFLQVFGMDRYDGDETGSKIIIPFIDEEKIMDSIKSGPSSYKENFYYDLDEYINLAIQRWYAPRLNNPRYIYGKKNNLIASINNNIITTNDQEKYFNIIREMYNYAIDDKKNDLEKLIKKSSIHSKTIDVTGPGDIHLSNRTVGTFVYILVKYNEVGMSNMYNANSPVFLSNLKINEQDNDLTNKPIILFTRQPGMIVNYVNPGDWILGNNEFEKSEYLIGLFVLNSDPTSYFTTLDGDLSLEEYVRKSEKSDHIEWYDNTFENKSYNIVEPRIISRVKNNISRQINNQFFKKDTRSSAPTDVSSHLSSLFGKELMPEGMGVGGSKRNPGARGPSGTRPTYEKFSRQKIEYDKIKYNKDQISIPFEIKLRRSFAGTFEINLFINSSGGKFDLEGFESEFSYKSPIEINNINWKDSDFNIKKGYTNNYQSLYSVVISSKKRVFDKDDLILGDLIISTKDNKISPFIEVKEVISNE